VPIDARFTRRRMKKTREHLQRRRLPGPIRPEKSNALTRRDFEIDPIDGPHIVVLPSQKRRHRSHEPRLPPMHTINLLKATNGDHAAPDLAHRFAIVRTPPPHRETCGGVLPASHVIRRVGRVAVAAPRVAHATRRANDVGQTRYSLSASAPPMISMSSLVIAAWRARLYCSVRRAMASFALRVAESIAVICAPKKPAWHSRSAR